MTRAIAFYLPQFHPIPENDAWWGEGFTEWTNTAKARPLFDGHYQPHEPAELGYYDLRDPEVRQAQAQLARRYGIEGFCYYHYWFGDGRRLLERPFDEVLASGAPDLPFCLCWANHTWSGIWHGAPDRILMEQRYPGEDDARAHFGFLLRAFRDARYMRVDDRPLLVIYQPRQIPRPYIDLWRRLAEAAGLKGLFMLGVRHMRDRSNPQLLGLDGAIDMRIPLPAKSWVEDNSAGVIMDHAEIAHLEIPRREPGLRNFPCVGPSWDNTPRLGARGVVYVNSSPELFAENVRKAALFLAEEPPQQRLLFVKAWNEWAEGNHLEPDRKYGHQWLAALQRGLAEAAAA
ncbi:MAG: glycoside hydrolase family 99-like domain-containing protein [Hyphomicrobiales bacterium]|uniref:glycoside hydrolase family 99-like domain-containing protein n=1 Tax=Aestuariivirga sp. TaxID=2650926 RepID=UPI0035B2650E